MADGDGEVDLTVVAPWRGAQVWAPQPVGPTMKPRPRVSTPAAVPVAPRRDLADGVGEIIVDEVALMHPVLEHVVAPVTGEGISSAIGMAALALELISLTQGSPSAPRQSPATSAPSAEQLWGPDGPNASAPQCCRLAASDGRSCQIHPRPTMGW